MFKELIIARGIDALFHDDILVVRRIVRTALTFCFKKSETFKIKLPVAIHEDKLVWSDAFDRNRN